MHGGIVFPPGYKVVNDDSHMIRHNKHSESILHKRNVFPAVPLILNQLSFYELNRIRENSVKDSFKRTNLFYLKKKTNKQKTSRKKFGSMY